MPTSEEREVIRTSGRNSPRTLVAGELQYDRNNPVVDFVYLVISLLFEVVVG